MESFSQPSEHLGNLLRVHVTNFVLITADFGDLSDKLRLFFHTSTWLLFVRFLTAAARVWLKQARETRFSTTER